jgi:hypothetical protein
VSCTYRSRFAQSLAVALSGRVSGLGFPDSAVARAAVAGLRGSFSLLSGVAGSPVVSVY